MPRQSGGGIGYSGQTTCVSGACCQYVNVWYSQCLPSPCSGTGGGSSTTSSTMLRTTTSSASTTKTASYGTFTNPVVYEDFADNDVFLGPDNAYYFSASNMHYSPGATTTKSQRSRYRVGASHRALPW
ncbi:hypothetical protein BDZ91DRAFT_800004 [Kalaharituber pfeilii]|nr:hypothetical protein BDZ91DRAFT_800004 [Kalaharituber pfeilii]